MLNLNKKTVFFAIGLCATQLSFADIFINATRVIYQSDKREVTFTVNNSGKKTSLIQSWVDEGNAKETPDNTTAPFILTPPISIIPAEKAQNIRMRFTADKKMAEDRETLFWINVLEVPQNTEAENQLRIALRTRIKMFFRPAQLAIKPEDVHSKINWKLTHKDGKWVAIAQNNSPYYVTFASINIKTPQFSGKAQLLPQTSMIAPTETLQFSMEPSKENQEDEVKFSIINDYGGTSEYSARVNN